MGILAKSKGNVKKISIGLILLSFIVWVIVDSVAKNCVVVEKESCRQRRLVCDDQDYNASEVVFANFTCGSKNSDGWKAINRNNTKTCEKAASCISVATSDYLDWVRDNPELGIFVNTVVYVLATVLFIPGSVLTIGTGAALGAAFGLGWGVLAGSLAVLVGANVGAGISFFVGRYLLRDFVKGFAEKYTVLKAIDLAMEKNGRNLVFLLRLSPLVPFNVFNYFMGVTSVSFKEYALASLAGMVPGTVAFVFLGAALAVASTDGDGECTVDDECEENDSTITTIVLIVGGIATVLAAFLLAHQAKKELDKHLELASQGSNTQESQQTSSASDGNKVSPDIDSEV